MSILLSVCIRAFNQETFIREALESALMQKTNFPFEIIVSDDCSTDSTKEIIESYQKRFPDKVRFISGETNVGGPLNLQRVIEASNAKYITCLDGDDYYTDTYKLQKQVDFLESHSEYVGCFHNVLNANKDGKNSLFLSLDFPSVHTAEDIISKKWFMPIHSIVMRREYVFFPEWYDQVMNDDYVVILSVALHGPFFYMPDVMAVYRHHEANISNAFRDQIAIDGQLIKVLEGFLPIYPEQYHKLISDRIMFYQERIKRNKKDLKYPFRKWLKIKTYKRVIKKLIFHI